MSATASRPPFLTEGDKYIERGFHFGNNFRMFTDGYAEAVNRGYFEQMLSAAQLPENSPEYLEILLDSGFGSSAVYLVKAIITMGTDRFKSFAEQEEEIILEAANASAGDRKLKTRSPDTNAKLRQVAHVMYDKYKVDPRPIYR